MGEADSLLNWTPIAKSEVGNWTEQGAAKVSCSRQTRDSHNRRPHTAEDTEKIKQALDETKQDEDSLMTQTTRHSRRACHAKPRTR
jgi:hypothetical protein